MLFILLSYIMWVLTDLATVKSFDSDEALRSSQLVSQLSPYLVFNR